MNIGTTIHHGVPAMSGIRFSPRLFLLGAAVSVVLTGCLSEVLETDDSDNSGNSNVVVRTNRPVWCQERDATNPLNGCWVSPRCDFEPRNFIGTDDPTDEASEDYWFKSVVSFVTDPGYTVLVNGQLVDLNGRWFLGGLWFTNANCSGDPAFYTDNFIRLFYRNYGTLATREGLDAIVSQMIGNAHSANDENLRSYDIYYITETGCFYGQDITSLEVDIPEDPGEQVLTGLDLEHRFTFSPPGSEIWMTNTLVNIDAWETFSLYQGNNVWVNTADKYR